MRAIASWLTARPWNAVFGLALSLVLPLAPVLSGAAMVLLVLAQGWRRPALYGLAALVLLSGLMALAHRSPVVVVVDGLIAWLPVAVLAVVMQRSRSLTLALQLSVLMAAMLTVGFFAVLGDPTDFWRNQWVQVAELFAQSGSADLAATLKTMAEQMAPQMTMLFVLMRWSLVVVVILLGVALYRQRPGAVQQFGRFCDLNFGRVLAVVMALSSLVAAIAQWPLAENLAYVMFAVFWMQGLAVLHWLRAEGPLPPAVLAAVYVLLPFLNMMLLTALAVLGYTDAWFDFRARVAAAKGRKGPPGSGD